MAINCHIQPSKWMNFDDAISRDVDSKEVSAVTTNCRDAYLLFYKNRGSTNF